MEKELSDKDANKLYWKDYYELCKKCKEKCKQSCMALQVVCKKYNKIEE